MHLAAECCISETAFRAELDYSCFRNSDRLGVRTEIKTASGPTEADQNWRDRDEKVLAGYCRSDRARRGCARVRRRHGCPSLLHKAPPMVAAYYDWSGFYVGINGGWGSSRKCWDFTTPAGAFVGAEGCHDATGGTVGGQIGYRWQAASWVFGLEAQGNWADFNGSNVSLFIPGVHQRLPRSRPSACSPARSATPSTTRCSTSRAVPR